MACVLTLLVLCFYQVEMFLLSLQRVGKPICQIIDNYCCVLSIVPRYQLYPVVDVLRKTYLTLGKLEGNVNLMKCSTDNKGNTNPHCSLGM